MHMRHKQSGKTVIAIKSANATVLAQFDSLKHPQSHGWHLYPISAFKRTNTSMKGGIALRCIGGEK
jgi:hypothetical protein